MLREFPRLWPLPVNVPRPSLIHTELAPEFPTKASRSPSPSRSPNATAWLFELPTFWPLFSKNPVAAAVVCRVIDYLKEHCLVERCFELGDYLADKLETLRSHPTVGDIRGKGLQRGLEFVRDKQTKASLDPKIHFSQQIQDEALLRGVHIESSSGCNRGQSGDTIIFGPPFIVTKEQIDELIGVIDETLTVVEKKAGF